MNMTPKILLGLSLALSMGCTPSNNSPQAQTGQSPIAENGGQDEGLALQDQELVLEGVGLKFVIDHHQQDDQDMIYVSWDQLQMQQWLDQQGQTGRQLQAAELELYLSLAEAEKLFDQELILKKNLVKLTLKNLK